MSRPEDNPRNELEELLRGYGLKAEDHLSVQHEEVDKQVFVAEVVLSLPDGERVAAKGARTVGKKSTTRSACAALLADLRSTHTYLFTDWEALRVEAQAGDALIKLAAYLSPDLSTPAAASTWLQGLESNQNLAAMFDAWKAEGHRELSRWGAWLSEHRKGTLVEALVWRELGSVVVSERGRVELEELVHRLQRRCRGRSEDGGRRRPTTVIRLKAWP